MQATKVRLIGLINGYHAGSRATQNKLVLARELYTGNRLFDHALAYCEGMYDNTFILSALHGVVSPNEMVYNYDRDVRYFSMQERREWAENIKQQFDDKGINLWRAPTEQPTVIWWHAARPFVDLLKDTWPDDMQQFPMLGLGQGAQMQFYVSKGF